MSVVIEGRDVSVLRGDVPLVSGVDISVREGEILGIVGESGAGKTLTVRALLGLLPSGLTASGTVSIADHERADLSDPPAGWRRSLAGLATVVLQDPTRMFDPMMRVGDQLVEAPHAGKGGRHDRAQRARELLRAFGFRDPDGVLPLFPHQLSGGMAQRVAIAMALVPRPGLVVLDEPTSALDPELRRDVFRWMRVAADERGLAVIMITHDLRAVRRVSDALAVMYAGKVVEAGPTSQLLAAPRHPYLKALARLAFHRAERRQPLPVLRGAPRHAASAEGGCAFAPRCELAFDRCDEEPTTLQHGGRSVKCHRATDAGALSVEECDDARR